MSFENLCAARHSVRKYEPGIAISDAELKKIFSLVIQGPSSFNIQHWRFIVVRDQARKAALKDLSFGQTQVEDCAAVVLVCGGLEAFKDARRIYADTPQDIQDKYVPMIEGSYDNQPALQRDEVIRTGSMAAMSLMYAAKDHGWDTGPMIGFDASKVSEYLELESTTVPVMMVVLGKALNGEQPPRAYRRPLEEVVKLETEQGKSLSA
ncbi:MAG: nitroreductase family protein [Gammaproteobacteria bacterium]